MNQRTCGCPSIAAKNPSKKPPKMGTSLPAYECPASLWLDLMRQFFAIPASKKCDFFSMPHATPGNIIETISNYFAVPMACFLLTFLISIAHNDS
ncbi:MAG: hypothetical protein L7F78_00660 [Syntrophales bacterium LBB04]|nr:hypothetical protein [Syntrophales bacterium LBB04]